MAFFQVGDHCRLVLWSQQTDQAGLMVHHYRCSASGGAGVTDQNAVDALSTIFAPLVKAMLSINAAYAGATLQIIRPNLRPTVYSTNSNGIGMVAGDPLPRQAAGLITLRTNEAGRKGRGRKYVPFPSEGDNANGVGPAPAYMANAATLGAAFVAQRVITAMVGDTATLVPVIYHRANPIGSPDVSSYFVRAKWATQRRRGSFGKPNQSPF